jgi:hypothetical protein
MFPPSRIEQSRVNPVESNRGRFPGAAQEYTAPEVMTSQQKANKKSVD